MATHALQLRLATVPTNASNKPDLTIFFNELTFLVRHIPKPNVPIIGRNMNAYKDMDRN